MGNAQSGAEQHVHVPIQSSEKNLLDVDHAARDNNYQCARSMASQLAAHC